MTGNYKVPENKPIKELEYAYIPGRAKSCFISCIITTYSVKRVIRLLADFAAITSVLQIIIMLPY